MTWTEKFVNYMWAEWGRLGFLLALIFCLPVIVYYGVRKLAKGGKQK